MDWDYLIPIVVLVLIFGPRMLGEVKDFLLKKEQIKADTELKAEALRLKNILELEKFMESGDINTKPNKKSKKRSNEEEDDESDETLNQRRNSQYEKY
ncbi:MAG: hypothetical protein K0R50_613 [Eubacterium sp.]|jgi:hypothetical protein|nr:hypothetical protein [Eubacterium sp.]